MTDELMRTETDGVSISINAPQKPEHDDLVTDIEVKGLYNEILDDIRKDEISVQEVYEQFHDMVINGGDATSSSKEALINLLKIKSDMADKKTKVMDLFFRVKLRERDTFPKYLVNNQKNTIVNGKIDQKKLLEELTSEQKN